VYSAHWVASASSGAGSSAARQLVIDARFQELEPGPIQVRMQFSKPMDEALTPAATLGRQSPFNELTLQANGSVEGWQKTVYSNDTWIGEATIPSGGDTTDPWTLSVAATDPAGLGVDGDPSTLADYATGTGGWMGYEGQGTGSDNTNLLPPSLQPGRVEIAVDSPIGGEHLAAGAPLTVNWTLSTNVGFTPTEQQIYLSTDSGVTFIQLAGGISGSADSFNVSLPLLTTTEGRIRVVARNTSIGSAALGDSLSNFTIGANVGSGVSLTFVSSQLVNQAWSDTGSVGGSAAVSGNMELAVTVKVTNTGSVAIGNPFLFIPTLNKGDVLVSRDKNTPQESGAIQSFDPGAGTLAPGQSVNVTLTVGLVKHKKFMLAAQVFGVPAAGTVGGASPVTLWLAKPANR
ncbi:MAG: hypothetical protein ACREDR_38645, partial [Blastocatellia bacterium]